MSSTSRTRIPSVLIIDVSIEVLRSYIEVSTGVGISIGVSAVGVVKSCVSGVWKTCPGGRDIDSGGIDSAFNSKELRSPLPFIPFVSG